MKIFLSAKLTSPLCLQRCAASLFLLVCIVAASFSQQAQAELSGSSGAIALTSGSGTLIVSSPLQITNPGTYYLTQDVVCPINCDGVDVFADNVVLDLNGHTITTSASGSTYDLSAYNSGVYSGNHSNLTVRNGQINGFFYGVFFSASLNGQGKFDDSYSFGHVLEDLSLNHNTSAAVYIQGGDSVVRRCQATATGGSAVQGQTMSCGLLFYGTGNRVLDCDVSQVTRTATGNYSYGIGFWINAVNCFAQKNRLSGMDYGILYDSASSGKYAKNLSGLSVGRAFTGGTDAGSNITDSNTNGLDDDWEMHYFGNLSHATSEDYDGDGLTNLQEYQQGSAPTDYYNRLPTNLAIDSGNNQSAAPNAVAASPLVVKVTDGTTSAVKTNAPVTFASATALLSTAANGTFTSSLQVRTNSLGKTTVYLKLPATGVFHQVTATANGETSIAQAVFSATLTQLTSYPASISFSANQGESQQQRTFALANTFAQTVNFVLDPSTATVASTPQSAANPEYNWLDSGATGGPAYVWNDISATGRLLGSLSDADDAYERIDLPFSFSFCGRSYPYVYVSSNGYLMFDGVFNSPNNFSLPSGNFSFIAPFFDDLSPSASGEIYWQADADKVVIQYNNVAPAGTTPLYAAAGNYTFQVVLDNSGVITFYYKTMANTVTLATVGVQNGGSPSHAWQAAYNQAYLHDSMAVRFWPTALPWLQLSGYTGSVKPGTSATVTAATRSLSTLVLPAGTYTTAVHVKDSGGNTVGPDVPITLTVGSGAPADTDQDGLPDSWENARFGNLSQGANDDPDRDGLSNLLEYQLGSDPNNPDTNGDGIIDGAAYRLGVSVTNLDMDGDGVSNAVERQQGSDPFTRDSDRDGVADGQDAFPLDPTRAQAPNAALNDRTPPVITLTSPSGAVLLP